MQKTQPPPAVSATVVARTREASGSSDLTSDTLNQNFKWTDGGGAQRESLQHLSIVSEKRCVDPLAWHDKRAKSPMPRVDKTPWPERGTPFNPTVRASLLALIASVLNCSVVWALGGTGAAPIDESAISVTLHVNAAASSGGNGTLASPFNTLQAAVNRAVNPHNAAGQGVRILVAPGTYREGTPGGTNSISLPTPATAAPLIIEGSGWNPAAPANTGEVILSGSDPWNGGWTDQGDGTWTRPWPYTWGVGPNNTGGGNPPEAMLRYELVHVNGMTYYQMLGPTDPNLANLTASEGAFWVNEASGILTIRPPNDFGDLNAAHVEVTTRRRLLHHWRPQATTSPTNIVLRNLVFQHAAPGLNSGTIFMQNVIGLHVEDCVFRDNKQMGLSVVGINTVFTVRRTDVIRNGEMGSGFQGINILAEDVRWSDNSRFADVIEYYGWGYGGIKIGATSNLTFRRIEAARNYGMGLWFDTGNVNCLVEDAVIVDNTSQGVWSENNNRNNIPALGETPTVVLRRVYVAGNYKRSPQATVLGGGFYITESENIRIENSVLYDNAIQFRVSDGPGRGPIANTTVRSSVLASRQGEVQRIYATGYGTTGWQQFFDTLASETGDNDYYYSGSTDGVTALSPQPQPVTTLAFYTRAQQLTQTLANWKSLHALQTADQDSRWVTDYVGQPLIVVEPAASYRQETSGVVDGWFVRRVSRDVTTPLTVNLAATGTATPGVHHQTLPTTVVIPAGARHVIVPFSPIQSGQNYGEHTVTLGVSPDAAYHAPDSIASFILEDAASAGQPRVSIVATTPVASEDGLTAGEFTLRRTGATASPLTVTYSLGGSASAARYQSLPGQVTFAAGSDTATVSVIPIDDAIPQLSETITLTVVSGSGYIPSIQDPTTATVIIRDNDIVSPVHVTLPPGDSALVVPVVLRNPAASPQTFTVSLPDNSSSAYVWSDNTQSGGPDYEWIDIHAIAGRTEISELRGQDDATTRFANGQSGTTGGIPLGFTFPFFSGNFDRLWVHSNGVLDFGTRSGNSRWTNQPLPNMITSQGNTSLAEFATSAHLLFFWDDLRFVDTAPASRAYYARPDANTFLLTVENLRHFSNTSVRLTAQVVLKSDGEIRVNYQDVTIPFNLGSTIGLQGTANEGYPYVQVSYNNDTVQSGMSLRFRRPIRWLSSAQNTFQVVVPAGGTAAFDVSFDAADLPLGEQTSTVLITSTHPDQPDIALPVSLTIANDAPPSAPVNLVASAVSNTTISLDWTDIADDETSQRLERAPSPSGPWTIIAELAADTESYLDTGLETSTTYTYRLVATNTYGDSAPSNLASGTTGAITDVAPLFTDSATLDVSPDVPFARLLRVDQEIRAFFSEGPHDTYPGTAGAGWLDPWTNRATLIDTVTSAALLETTPIAAAGPYVQLTATASGAGKRAFLTRSYDDDPVRRIARTAPHRIVLELRPDNLSGFTTTNDRLYLWDRPTPSNADHNNTDMTWAFLTAGSPREWRYYAGTAQTSTGVHLVEGHTYRFSVEVDPAQHRWRFTLRDVDWQPGDPGAGVYSTSSDWIAFRNAGAGAPSVGGHLHAGAFLNSPQTLRVALDSVRITAADLAFSAGTIPSGMTFDSEIGRLTGTVSSGSGSVLLSVSNPFGTTWRTYAYTLAINYAKWSLGRNWPEPVESTTAADADPDRDGIPNLLEFALNGNPLGFNTSALPEHGITSIGGANYPTLTIAKNPEADGISYIVESSSDLSTWRSGEGNTVVISDTTSELSVRTTAAVTQDTPQFLRLRVVGGNP